MVQLIWLNKKLVWLLECSGPSNTSEKKRQIQPASRGRTLTWQIENHNQQDWLPEL